MKNASLRSDRLNLHDYSAFYQSTRFVVSNRLHCLLCGAVPIALTTRNHKKLVSLFETVGLSELLVYLDEPDALHDHLQRIVDRYSTTRRLVEQVCANERTTGKTVLARLFQ